MLDVVTIVRPDTPADWDAQRRATTQEAAQAAGYPVRLVEVPWVPGHVGQAMLEALRVTRAPYLAWVDDDDYVLPRAFACLAPHFAGNPQAICAREIQQGARGQQVRVPRRHHLTAWRRDVLEGWREEIGGNVAGLTSTASAQALLRDGVAPDVVDVLEFVYVWRRYLSGGMALRNLAKRRAS